MTLAPLLDLLGTDPAVARALAVARAGEPVADLAVPAGARPALVAALARDSGRPILAVTATTREAEDLVAALGCYLDPDRVADFPAWETLPHERLSPRSDTVGKRLAVLRRLKHPDPTDATYGPLDVVVAPVRAVLQPVSQGLGDLAPVALKAGDEAPLEQVVEDLAAAAYTRTDLVERRGEFAVRGGILDVFPPTEDHPVRVEFWGDTVEEIRWFKVADQRSLEVAEHGLWAPPCREVLLDRVGACSRECPDRPAPGRGRPAVQAGRGHRRRGDGVPGAGPRRRHGERPRHAAGRHRGRAVRPRARPHASPRPGRHEPGVPRGRLGQRRGRQQRADRPPGHPRHRLVLEPRRPARPRRAGGYAVVGPRPVRRRRGARRR